MATTELLLRLHRRAVPTDAVRFGLFALAPALFIYVLYVLFYIQFAGRLVLFPFGWDQGEGYDAWSAWLVAQGQLPYSHNGTFPYFSINYPPLWSTLVSIPLALTGPSLAPARAFSALVTLIDAVLIAAAAWRLSDRGQRLTLPLLAACLAGVFFLASPYVFHTTPLSRLNSTLTCFTLLALTFAERPTVRRVGLAVLCVLAVGFTKPTGLVTAVACLAWIVAIRPRLGVAATGLLVGAAGLILLTLNAATGGAFWLNVVTANTGKWDAAAAATFFLNFGSLHAAILAFALTECWSRARARGWTPWMVALAASLLEGSLVGHAGAGESYFLNAVAVASILAGVAIARVIASFAEQSARQWDEPIALAPSHLHALALKVGHPMVLIGLLLFVQALVMAHGPLSQLMPQLPDRGIQGWILGREPAAADRAAGDEIVELIRASSGPVLSEEPSFPLVAGKTVVANANHLRDLDAKGLWDSHAVVRDIEERRFGLILLNAQRYPPRVLAAIGRSYYVVRAVPMGASTYLVFLPGGNPPATAEADRVEADRVGA